MTLNALSCFVLPYPCAWKPSPEASPHPWTLQRKDDRHNHGPSSQKNQTPLSWKNINQDNFQIVDFTDIEVLHPEELRILYHSSLVNLPSPSLSALSNIFRIWKRKENLMFDSKVTSSSSIFGKSWLFGNTWKVHWFFTFYGISHLSFVFSFLPWSSFGGAQKWHDLKSSENFVTIIWGQGMLLARGDLMDWWRMRGPGGMSPSHYQSTQTQHSSPPSLPIM